MKNYIKNYKSFLNEGKHDFDNTDRLNWLLSNTKLKKEQINFIDGKVVINGNLNLMNKKLLAIPFKIHEVSGDLDITNNKLKKSENLPDKVDGSIFAFDAGLTTFSNFPKEIGGDVDITDNKAITMEGLPKIINGDFSFYYENEKYVKGFPNIVNGNIKIDLPFKYTRKDVKQSDIINLVKKLKTFGLKSLKGNIYFYKEGGDDGGGRINFRISSSEFEKL